MGRLFKRPRQVCFDLADLQPVRTCCHKCQPEMPSFASPRRHGGAAITKAVEDCLRIGEDPHLAHAMLSNHHQRVELRVHDALFRRGVKWYSAAGRPPCKAIEINLNRCPGTLTQVTPCRVDGGPICEDSVLKQLRSLTPRASPPRLASVGVPLAYHTAAMPSALANGASQHGDACCARPPSLHSVEACVTRPPPLHHTAGKGTSSKV
eukprot:6460033-Amphidinium_carterae.2